MQELYNYKHSFTQFWFVGLSDDVFAHKMAYIDAEDYVRNMNYEMNNTGNECWRIPTIEEFNKVFHYIKINEPEVFEKLERFRFWCISKESNSYNHHSIYFDVERDKSLLDSSYPNTRRFVLLVR
jgi:hypothetical protein